MSSPISFEIIKRQSGTLGRAGVIKTPHGDIETPAFVVVGTKGTVKSIKPEDMREYVGNQVALANTYHLFPLHQLQVPESQKEEPKETQNDQGGVSEGSANALLFFRGHHSPKAGFRELEAGKFFFIGVQHDRSHSSG